MKKCQRDVYHTLILEIKSRGLLNSYDNLVLVSFSLIVADTSQSELLN